MPQNFSKSPPYFWLALYRTNVRWRFRKILWPSQNIWTLICSKNKNAPLSIISTYCFSTYLSTQWYSTPTMYDVRRTQWHFCIPYAQNDRLYLNFSMNFCTRVWTYRRACGFQNLVWTPVYRVGIICPPGWDRVKVAAKTWCGHVPSSTCPQARLLMKL